MAADVSSLVRVMSGYKDDQHGSMSTDSTSEKSTALITRDLLGGGSASSFSPSKLVNDTQELDLDLQVPNGWEKRLDLKSGKVYLQRCSNPSSNSATHHHKNQTNTTVPKLQDLNFPVSPSSKTPLNLFDDTSLELKLVSSSSPSSKNNNTSSSTSPNYQSVCTLDKVKSALERAEKEPMKRRSSSSLWKSSSPSYSSSSSSIKEGQEEDNNDDNNNNNKLFSSSFAAGCPGCLTYVLIMKNNPKCPRCNSVIPLPLMKKPRIDLNMAI
ncbi:uncharacterized protein LOC133829923 [Humulus lupulus]|uniref:uncharacterized protein LOC133829923 n=1 Tax=Humulus lupulus TaxID=3486 RepID=UPI002B407C6C|nr:uncharacterized protein LOC133829923 [Humulus lupulus]